MTQRFDSECLPLPRRRRERRGISRALLCATIVLLVNALFGEHGLRETLLARNRYAHATRELQSIRLENAALRERVRRLSEDPRTIEIEARRSLGLARPGELLFVVKTR